MSDAANEVKDITGNGYFAFPKKGTSFFFKGAVVNLKAISERRARQLAADPSCTFIERATVVKSTPSSTSSPTGAKEDK